jgi:hypothetical protein
MVGISGSPFPRGDTDRLVQSLLEQSGRERTFVNLSSLDFAPCRRQTHGRRTSAVGRRKAR